MRPVYRLRSKHEFGLRCVRLKVDFQPHSLARDCLQNPVRARMPQGVVDNPGCTPYIVVDNRGIGSR